jgi:hypothetical protein
MFDKYLVPAVIPNCLIWTHHLFMLDPILTDDPGEAPGYVVLRIGSIGGIGIPIQVPRGWLARCLEW